MCLWNDSYVTSPKSKRYRIHWVWWLLKVTQNAAWWRNNTRRRLTNPALTTEKSLEPSAATIGVPGVDDWELLASCKNNTSVKQGFRIHTTTLKSAQKVESSTNFKKNITTCLFELSPQQYKALLLLPMAHEKSWPSETNTNGSEKRTSVATCVSADPKVAPPSCNKP